MPPHAVPPASRRRAATLAFAMVLTAAASLAGILTPALGQIAAGYGAGVFVVDGSFVTNFTLADGGTYYLIVATDTSSDSVSAQISYNGSLAANVNGTGSAAVLVSLAPGNYSVALVGHGRAALGWDFTDGAVQDFPDNENVSGFLRPASAHVDVIVSMGNAQEIHLEVYDDLLLPVKEANVTTSGAVGVDLPAAHATSAFLLASVVTGAPQGLFGIAWSSPSPPTAGPDLGAQMLSVVVWIAVPVVFALAVFLLLRRRNRFP